MSGWSPPAVQRASFEQIRMVAEGLLSQNFPREGAQAGSALVDGTVYYLGVGLPAGVRVANVSLVVSSAGAGVTLSKVGIYNGTELVASSADQGASWQSTGLKTIALSASYLVPSQGLFYVAIVTKATVTLPSMLRDTSQGNLATAIGTGARPFANQTGQVDLPNPAVLSGAAAIGFWVGLS